MDKKIPQSLPFSRSDLNLHLTHQSQAHSTHHPKPQLDRFTHFYTAMPQSSHWLQYGTPHIHPQHCHLRLEIQHITPQPGVVLKQFDSPLQTASRSPQPSLNRPTDRPTAPVTRSVPITASLRLYATRLIMRQTVKSTATTAMKL